MDEKKALHVLRECVNIACSKYPGVASDYIVALRSAEKAMQERKPQGDIIDLIKALRCLGSQYCGMCHMDRHNLAHPDGPFMRCFEDDMKEDYVHCPYHQKKYDTCFEDGYCAEWLNEAAELLERMMPDAESKG